jgi:hypothetical protein
MRCGDSVTTCLVQAAVPFDAATRIYNEQHEAVHAQRFKHVPSHIKRNNTTFTCFMDRDRLVAAWMEISMINALDGARKEGQRENWNWV